MKTRIISAAVLIAFVIGVLTVSKLYCPLIVTFFIAVICAIGIYELTHNAAKIENKAFCIVAGVYGALRILLLSSRFTDLIGGLLTFDKTLPLLALTVFYFLFAVIAILYLNKSISLGGIFALCAFPYFLSYAFSMLSSIIVSDRGIYYLLLIVNFASVCDTGAYFVGSFFGKHKLCPNISPKKTVEGAIGGIVSSVIVSVILSFAFSSEHIIATLVLTIPLCIVGMLGDLFASAIKRSVGLKDYGNLIPGHGGILDRFDSMLLITPFVYLFALVGVL